MAPQVLGAISTPRDQASGRVLHRCEPRCIVRPAPGTCHGPHRGCHRLADAQREHLLTAAEDALREEIRAERQVPAGDATAAVRAIFDHYEARGDQVLLMLAQEHWNAQIRAINDGGRGTHRQWVEAVFGPQLEAVPKRVAAINGTA